MWNPFKRKEERTTLEEILISSGVLTSSVSKQQALAIPAFSACVDLISSTVASLPVKLFEEKDEEISNEVDDPRVDLLNDDTSDTMDGFQFKKAMVEDFLIHGGGYGYINRVRNDVKSLNFVSNQYVSVMKNTDPIFKKAEITVNGAPYRDFQFIKLLRKTHDGVTGRGILKESNTMLSVAYNHMMYENVLVATGGNKKGFLKSQGRLSPEALTELKKGWKDLYANNNENVLVLNNGLEFQEASQTSVEMQMNENKRTNSDEICKTFLVTPRILSGEANEEEYDNWVKICILPVLAAFEAALNKDLLLPSEKEGYFFAFDTHDLTKGEIRKRYQAYELGIKNGFMQIDEVRHKENLAPLKLNWIKLGLQDVLFFPDSDEIYTPNTNKLAKMGENPTVDPIGTTPNPNLNPNGGVANESNQGISDKSGSGQEPSNQSNNSGEGK